MIYYYLIKEWEPPPIIIKGANFAAPTKPGKIPEIVAEMLFGNDMQRMIEDGELVLLG